MKDTTIAALATFPAESAIGIIRVSGRDAFSAASKVFIPVKTPFKSLKPGKVSLGGIFSGKEKIDEAMITIFKSPCSYTGEDMVEISCHGNPYILDKVLSLLMANGCVPAGPGEFTKRAFLNGKMDLARAEAVADIISAKNDPALKLAVSQFSGGESAVIKNLRGALLKLLSLVEAEIDFAHEDIQKTKPAEAAALAREILDKISQLIKNAGEGIMLKSGIKTALAGRPNTGKSSLLNALLKKDRAIVTDSPGTTRDTVEGLLLLGGLLFRLIDTAGIRRAKSRAENHGIKKALNTHRSSDIAVLVLDSSKKLCNADLAVYRALKTKNLVLAANKSDLKNAFTPAEAAAFFSLPPQVPVIPVSAKTKKGINALTNALKNIIIMNGPAAAERVMIASLRHKKELESARRGMIAAIPALKKGSFEEAAFDLKQAACALGSITGEISGEEVLAGIFKKFCIGK